MRTNAAHVARSGARPGERARPAEPEARSRGRLRLADAERRRREQHFRLRRRDLLVDAALGLLLAVVLLAETAGLGVLALLVLPAAFLLLVSGLVRRRSRRRHSPHG
jgi:Flp pilus assembly protein TadB